MIKKRKKKQKKRCIRSDYHRKNLKNPFYKPKTGKSFGNKIRLMLWSIIAVLLIGFLFWLFLLSNYFLIKNIKIEGLTILEQDVLEKLVFNQSQTKKMLIFKKNNFFIFSKKELELEILDRYNFADLELKKVLPHTIQIKIMERPYAFIWQDKDEMYYSSADGYIIKEVTVSEEDKEKYFILENKSLAIRISARNKLNLSPDFLNFTLKTSTELKKYPNLIVDRLIIEQELNSLIIALKNGPKVYLNIKNNPEEKIADLDLVIKEKLSNDLESIQYIDLRYGDYIFIL